MARRLTVLGALALLMGALAAIAGWAASESVDVRGVFAIAAANGKVLVGAGREVLLTDEGGHVLATLTKPTAEPWRFDDVSSVAFARNGELLVCDAGRRVLVRFSAVGTNGHEVHLDDPPRLTFEVADLGTGYAIADTMGNEVRVTDAAGKTLRRRSVRYPNALDTAGENLVLVSTGAAKAFRYDVATLELVSDKLLDAVSASRARGAPHRELFDMTLLSDGRAVATDCRSTHGECTLVRVDVTGKLERIADTVPFEIADPEITEGLLSIGELATTSDGSVLAASPRLGVVLRFAGPAGAPPGGFCESCSEAELSPHRLDVWSLPGRPFSWPNGAQVSLFGDESVVRRYAAARDALTSLLRIERGARYGTFGVASALLFALFLSRQAGAADRPRALRTWAEVLRPNLGSYALVVLVIAAAMVAGGLPGWFLGGPSVALASGAVCAFFASRLVAAPLVAARLGSATALAAWKNHLGALEEGEPLRWVAFAWPRRGLKTLAAQAKEASGADDWLDLLESLAPRLSLVACTDRRIIVATTSMLGAPLDAPLTVSLPQPIDAPPSSLQLQTLRFARTWSFPASKRSPLALFCEPAQWLCRECRKPYGTCSHWDSALLGPVALSILLPGLGHLVSGDFGKARVMLLTSTGLLLEAVRLWLPQHIGTLPWNPGLWQQPLWVFALTGAVASVTIALGWWRDRVRAQLALTRARTQS